MNIKIPTDSNDPNKIYTLYEQNQAIIKGKFTWDGKLVTNIFITENTIRGLVIGNIEVIQATKCDDPNKMCNELHIKGFIHSETTINKKFKLSKSCDLSEEKEVNVYRVMYYIDELFKGLHNEQICSDCLIKFHTPDVKKGNILVGG